MLIKLEIYKVNRIKYVFRVTVVEEQIVYTFNELIADIGGGLGILKGPPLFNTKGPHFSAPKIPQFNKKKLLSSTHPS